METPAIVFQDKGIADLQAVEIPEPGAGEVQVETEFSVISVGTERWVFTDNFTWSSTPFPCVPGYQRVGVVKEVGPGVTEVHVGQRVLATNGQWNGVIRPFWGSHIGLANSPVGEVYPLTDAMDFIDAAGTVVAQVGYNAASRIRMSPGDWVVVYGDGLIGQCAEQAARYRGARTVMVGHREARLRLAHQLGANFVINGHERNVVPTIKNFLQGESVCSVIDTVQNEAVQQEYMSLLEPGHGQIVYSGFTPRASWADMGALQQREITCHFVAGWNPARMGATLDLIAHGGIRIRPLVTHWASFEKGPELYRMLLDNQQDFLAIVLDWRSSCQWKS